MVHLQNRDILGSRVLLAGSEAQAGQNHEKQGQDCWFHRQMQGLQGMRKRVILFQCRMKRLAQGLRGGRRNRFHSLLRKLLAGTSQHEAEDAR